MANDIHKPLIIFMDSYKCLNLHNNYYDNCFRLNARQVSGLIERADERKIGPQGKTLGPSIPGIKAPCSL